MAMTPFPGQCGAATPASTVAARAVKNKFVGRWSSTIQTSSGQVIDDGVLEISDSSEPSEDEVSVSHSVRGGPVIGHTMSFPDRIEIQILLGDGRVAHYNGVLVSATRIEGRFFLTGRPQAHHSRVRLPVSEEAWTATANT
jgi:hypothetical protein